MDREKLIELLRKPVEVFARGGVPVPTITICEQYAIAIADHLIANGVVVPVHCKDCKHWSDGVAGCTEHIKCCKIGFYMVGENGYCVYGERRTEILPYEVGDTIRITLPKDKKIMTYNGEEIDFDYEAEDL